MTGFFRDDAVSKVIKDLAVIFKESTTRVAQGRAHGGEPLKLAELLEILLPGCMSQMSPEDDKKLPELAKALGISTYGIVGGKLRCILVRQSDGQQICGGPSAGWASQIGRVERLLLTRAPST